MFRLNPINFTADGSLADSQMGFGSLQFRKSDAEMKKLQQDWPGIFRFLIMPEINEKDYAVLYSDDLASRPNVPVNITIGALYLKEFLTIPNDEELCESLANDDRLRYALCCEDMRDAPICVNSLRNFRCLVTQHYCETGDNLLYRTFRLITQKLSEYMDIKFDSRTMDSTPIEMWNKSMSRLLLLYTNNEVFIQAITGCKAFIRPEKTNTVTPVIKTVSGQISFVPQVDTEEEEKRTRAIREDRQESLKEAKQILPQQLYYYLDESNKNNVTYHSKISRDEKIKLVIKNAEALYDFCENHPEYKEIPEFQLFDRIFKEQCKLDGEHYVLKGKEDGMSSDIVQNPFDPEATYRNKDGHDQRGYTAAFTKVMNDDGDSILEDFVVDKNNVSDGELGARLLKNMPAADPSDHAVIAADSLFNSEEMRSLAESRHITIFNTNLTGIDPQTIHAYFEFDENGNISKCAGGGIPTEVPTLYSNGKCRAKIDKSVCEQCQFREQCQFMEQKSCNVVCVSQTQAERAMQMHFRETEEFHILSHLRNGVETIPSLLKNKYDIEKTRGKGVQPRAVRLALIGIAINFKNFVNFIKRQKMAICFA